MRHVANDKSSKHVQLSDRRQASERCRARAEAMYLDYAGTQGTHAYSLRKDVGGHAGIGSKATCLKLLGQSGRECGVF